MCKTKAHNEKSSAQLLALSHSPRRGMRVAEKSNKSPTTTLDSKSTPVRKLGASGLARSTPYDTMRWIDIDAHGWFDYGDHGTTRRVVRRSGSVVSDHMRSRKTTTASQTSFEELMWRQADVETASDVGRTLWAAGSRRTGAIEAEGGTPKFTPNDSCSFAHGPMQLTLWVVMVSDFVRLRRTLHEAEEHTDQQMSKLLISEDACDARYSERTAQSRCTALHRNRRPRPCCEIVS